jgi:hypothetical protein
MLEKAFGLIPETRRETKRRLRSFSTWRAYGTASSVASAKADKSCQSETKGEKERALPGKIKRLKEKEKLKGDER